MSELYERIVNRRGSFERFVARVPGFREYMERQAQRTANRMIRDYVACEVKKRINRLVEIEQLLLKQGMAHLTETSTVKRALQRYHDRIQSATAGYSGPLAHINTSCDDIEKLYNFDEAQIRYVDQFDEALKSLAQAVSEQVNVCQMIGELKQTTMEANELFSRRETILTNLSKLV